MKLLLLGGNGQVGRALRQSLAPLGELVVSTRDGNDADLAIDFLQPETLGDRVREVAPEVVVNAAAYTAVDRAEAEREVAFCVNATAPERLACACAEIGASLIHYSTDYVFDGSAVRPYREDDATAPLNVYGASKLAGEQAIRSSGARHAILRTAWVYDAHGRNFLRTMLKMARECESLRVVSDQLGTPTPAGWIAEATSRILDQGIAESGTWNLAASGRTSWHGFAEAIVREAFGLGLLARPVQVEGIATSQYPTPARRPMNSVLDTSKLCRDFGIAPPGWRVGLSAILKRMADYGVLD